MDAMRRRRMLAAATLLSWATLAQAEPEGSSSSHWQFTSTLYLWASDLKGDIRPAGDIEPVAVDLSFGKIFDHLKFAAMGGLEARKDRLIFLGDLNYVHLGASSGLGITDADLVDAELDATTFTATLLGG